MRILQVLILSLLVCGFSSVVKAQDDCSINLRLYVRDKNGNTPENVRIETQQFDFYYESEIDAYIARRLILVAPKYKVSLKVTAEGFDAFETKIEIACGFPSYELKLKTEGTREVAIFEKLVYFYGRVAAISGKVISKTRVILTDEKGKKTETFTNEHGYFGLDVESGKYSIEFIGADGFESRKQENFQLSKGTNNLDVILEKSLKEQN